jgi:hypothetical protein
MPEKHKGRPAADNPKTMRVDVRLTEGELEMLDNYCQQMGYHARRDCATGLRRSMQKNKKEVALLK